MHTISIFQNAKSFPLDLISKSRKQGEKILHRSSSFVMYIKKRFFAFHKTRIYIVICVCSKNTSYIFYALYMNIFSNFKFLSIKETLGKHWKKNRIMIIMKKLGKCDNLCKISYFNLYFNAIKIVITTHVLVFFFFVILF